MQVRKWILNIGLLVVFSQMLHTTAYANANGNKLYFKQEDGKMYYDSKTLNGSHKFMSFLKMVPGGKYQDELTIQNGCNDRTYDLYMKVEPIEQSELQDELLEKIHMKVNFDGEVLYEGTAMGKQYNIDGMNLQNSVYLGAYEPGRESKITVDVTLDHSVEVDMCDLLAKINWKFTVDGKNANDEPEELIPDSGGNSGNSGSGSSTPVKTGDDSNILFYCLIFFASGVTMYVVQQKQVKKHK